MIDPDKWGQPPSRSGRCQPSSWPPTALTPARSTGPKTPKGKAKSSLNPLTHGGYARLDAIDRGYFHEDPADIQAVLDQLRDAFQPSHPLLEQMLLQIARRWIGMRRYDRFEVLRMTDITTNGTAGVDKQALLADIDVLTRAAGVLLVGQSRTSHRRTGMSCSLSPRSAIRSCLLDVHARFDPDYDILPADVQAKVLASFVGGHEQSLDTVADTLDTMAARLRDRLPDPETERVRGASRG